ncbi:MAG: ATP-binding protein [Anaerolineae bacterium]|nr:ATP-binding protein [Anaerolineae bacterium]
MTAKSTYELTVAGYFKSLAKIAEFVETVAARSGLNDRAAYAIQMAVDEACTNIIEHAYGGEGDNPIRLVCDVQADGLWVSIYDQGQPFDSAGIPEVDTTAPLHERPSGGMGMFFIKKLTDTVEYKLGTPQGNQLLLFKRKGSTNL